MGTTRAGLKGCPLNSRERAILQAAREQVTRYLTQGATAQEIADAEARLHALRLPRQHRLAFPPSR